MTINKEEVLRAHTVWIGRVAQAQRDLVLATLSDGRQTLERIVQNSGLTRELCIRALDRLQGQHMVRCDAASSKWSVVKK